MRSAKPCGRVMALLATVAIGVSPVAAEGERGSDHDAPWSMADDHFDTEEMARSRHMVQKHHGGATTYLVMADRLEYQTADGVDTLLWDLQGWYGGDINKLWVKSEGDYSFPESAFEEAEVQALWSRAITTYFDLQAGVRWDFEPDRRAHFVAGLQGLAPYWFEIDAAGFISGEGDVTARIEAEVDLRLAQRVVLQPRLELELSAQTVSELDVGPGVTGFDLGVRAKYEVFREIAPYIGVEWQAAFGRTADLLVAAGEDRRQTVFVVGVTAWF